MNSLRARVAFVVALSSVALVALATPATAAPSISGAAVLADQRFKWFYWLGVVLVAGLVLWLLATLVGYYLRVIRPKHRGRETS